jgi:DNA-directed RNA polymerase subunit beta
LSALRLSSFDGAESSDKIKHELFWAIFPEMTPKGTFIINGTERVVVSQLIRSPGVYFEAETDRTTGRKMSTAKLIPDRGAWMEFETRKNDFIILKFNRKRTVPITVFLRALAALRDSDDDIDIAPLKEGTDEEILALFQDVDNNPNHLFIESSFEQELNTT